MNKIDQLFHQLQSEGKKAFIPFLTAGDPSVEGTVHLAEKLIGVGASLVEIGFPYSDAIADGPVIQASYTRALNRGLRIEEVFGCIQELARSEAVRQGLVPLVGMVSYSLVHRRGAEAFLEKSREVGLSGLIVPDLPFEESDNLRRMAKEADLKLIQLVTPTTPRDRALAIAQASTGFLYCVSVTGITGERDSFDTKLKENLAWLKEQTSVPLCVGFGISKPEHVEMLRDHADGIIVGSAFVRRFEQGEERPFEELAREITDLASSLIHPLRS